jgi:hypothetical protein
MKDLEVTLCEIDTSAHKERERSELHAPAHLTPETVLCTQQSWSPETGVTYCAIAAGLGDMRE